MLCKLWMDAQTYRWETNEWFYWPPIICQPVTDKINIRKVTNYYVPWCCKGLQGLLKKNLCSLSAVFLFWQFSLKSCPKSLSSSAFIILRKQPCTQKQKFPWKPEGSDSICKQHKLRPEKTHILLYVNFRQVICIV